jgi:site-specific recombinase XerD
VNSEHGRRGAGLDADAATSQNPGGMSAGRRRGRRPTALPARLESVHAAYRAALADAPLSAETRRTYASKTRQYLAWLHTAGIDGQPLTDPAARDRAVGDWRTHVLTVAAQAPTTVNNALAAVDDFYIRRGMGPAAAERTARPNPEPRALDTRAQRRWLRAVAAQPSARDRALAGIPFYAGARIAETVRLDVGDLHISTRTGVLRIHGTGDRTRDVPIHDTLRADIRRWLQTRPTWPAADTNPALFLNHRGDRLSVRGARDIIARIAHAAGLDHDTTAHVLRHTFATTLVRGGTDLVIVADLLGHARLDSTRAYTKPTKQDRSRALGLLPIHR